MIERKKLVKETSISFTKKWVHSPFLAWVSCEFFEKKTFRRDSQ